MTTHSLLHAIRRKREEERGEGGRHRYPPLFSSSLTLQAGAVGGRGGGGKGESLVLDLIQYPASCIAEGGGEGKGKKGDRSRSECHIHIPVCEKASERRREKKRGEKGRMARGHRLGWQTGRRNKERGGKEANRCGRTFFRREGRYAGRERKKKGGRGGSP